MNGKNKSVIGSLDEKSAEKAAKETASTGTTKASEVTPDPVVAQGNDEGGVAGAAVVPQGPDVPSDFVNQCLNANELGDGMLYAWLHQGQYVFVAQHNEWYYWVGHYWQRDLTDKAAGAVEKVALVYLQEVHALGVKIKEAEKAEEKDRAKKFRDRRKLFIRRVERLRSERGVRACLHFARLGDHALAITGEQLDDDPWILACANGVIDLKNGKLRPGRRDDWVTKASPVEYPGVKAISADFEKFTDDITSGRQEVVDYLRKTLGYSLTGLSMIHDFYTWAGIGRNGKGKLIEAIANVLGPLAAPIPSEMLLEQPSSRAASQASPDIMALKGLRIAYASETDEGRKFSAARVKWLTGGDYLTGRWPHDKYPVTFVPTHSLILLTNHKPRAQADDYAFWERCRLIRFPVSFVNDREPDPSRNERRADVQMSEKLKAAAPEILAWLVRGCLEWQRDNHLKPPAYVIEATAEYRREEDIVQEWLEEEVEIAPSYQARAVDLYKSFERWYNLNVGRKPRSPKWLGKQLIRRFDKVKKARGYVYLGLQVDTYDD